MESLRDMLKRQEGWRVKKYKDINGHWTIGVGWNMEANALPPDIASYLRVHGEITDAMVDQLLDISIEAATRQCEALYPGFNTFSERRRNALISFVFNVGSWGAVKFRKMREAVVAQDWEKAAGEMVDSAWYKQVGNRSIELVAMIREG